MSALDPRPEKHGIFASYADLIVVYLAALSLLTALYAVLGAVCFGIGWARGWWSL